MRPRHIRAESGRMESGSGRFRRADQLESARLRVDILALRRELELLAEVMRTGPTPLSACAELDRAFFCLRAAERTWRGARDPAELRQVVTHLDDARRALQESLEALTRRSARPSTAAG
jgi:hypothetical protein